MRKILWKAPSHCRNRDLKKNTKAIYVFPMKRRTIACLLQLCLGTSLLAMTVSAVWQLVCICLDFQCHQKEEAWHRLVGRNAFSFCAVDQGTVVCLLFFNLHEYQVSFHSGWFSDLVQARQQEWKVQNEGRSRIIWTQVENRTEPPATFCTLINEVSC